MSDTGGSSDALRQAFITSMQHAQQGQWPAAVETVRPLADSGDPVAIALAAWFMGQSGQAAQGVQYARQAVVGPIAAGPIAANYISWTTNDPALRQYTIEFFKAAVDAGWTVDPIGQAQQLVQQGEPDRGLELLTQARSRTATQAEHAWESLVAEIGQSQERVATDLQSVAETRANALADIRGHEAAIASERARVQELVDETTALVQNVAADNLATDYAQRAAAASARGQRWTVATLLVSVAAIALAALFVLFGLARNHDVSNVLAKAAISVPLLALAAYLNRLGSEERRDARSWTHIELQIRTARPYLGNLPDDLRQDVQAALALRFFPGQAQDPHGSSTEVDADEGLRLIREIRSQIAPSTAGTRMQPEP